MTADGRRAVSGSIDQTVRVWDLPELPAGGAKPRDQTIYTNAKVLLTGDSGAGKSGLAERLVYWQKQAYPVWLVIRTTNERTGTSIRWMDLSAYLKQESRRRKTTVKQVEFRGEPLTAQTLMALRDRIVPPSSG